MAERVLQRITSVNVYLSLAGPVNKPLSRAFARRLDTQSVEKSVSVNPALPKITLLCVSIMHFKFTRALELTKIEKRCSTSVISYMFKELIIKI